MLLCLGVECSRVGVSHISVGFFFVVGSGLMYGTTVIFVSEEAFMTMVLSSVEVYKRECLGVLLGTKSLGRILVEYAIPLQSSKRGFIEVETDWRRELKVLSVLPKLVHLEKLGYFHSHPQFGDSKGLPQLSDQDKKSMSAGEIDVVVAINDSARSRRWSETRNGLAGSLGDYSITISGYYKRKKDESIVRYRIVCPYAVGFQCL